MTQTHPITPPEELVQQWEEQFLSRPTINGCFVQSYIAAKAARWGADQELEACCAWASHCGDKACATELRAARRPKAPTLKEQALEALGPEPLPKTGPIGNTILNAGTIERHRLVRNALEALPND